MYQLGIFEEKLSTVYVPIKLLLSLCENSLLKVPLYPLVTMSHDRIKVCQFVPPPPPPPTFILEW